MKCEHSEIYYNFLEEAYVCSLLKTIDRNQVVGVERRVKFIFTKKVIQKIEFLFFPLYEYNWPN